MSKALWPRNEGDAVGDYSCGNRLVLECTLSMLNVIAVAGGFRLMSLP